MKRNFLTGTQKAERTGYKIVGTNNEGTNNEFKLELKPIESLDIKGVVNYKRPSVWFKIKKWFNSF